MMQLDLCTGHSDILIGVVEILCYGHFCALVFLLTLEPWSLLSVTCIDFSKQRYRMIIDFCIWRSLFCKRSGFSKAALLPYLLFL